jgi:thiol:disulfide interchange protein
VAINTPEFRDKIKALGVIAFRADFTSYDPAIAAAMRKYGRPNPPLNLIYPAGEPEAPIVLRPNLTKSYLLEQLDKAGPSTRVSGSRPAA